MTIEAVLLACILALLLWKERWGVARWTVNRWRRTKRRGRAVRRWFR